MMLKTLNLNVLDCLHVSRKDNKHMLENTFSNVSVNSNSVHPLPGQPRGKFFGERESRPPGQTFCLIPCPGAKNDGRIPGVGAKFLHTQRNYPLSLQKLLKGEFRAQDKLGSNERARKMQKNEPSLTFMCQLVLEISQFKVIFSLHKDAAIFMILSLVHIKKKSSMTS